MDSARGRSGWLDCLLWRRPRSRPVSGPGTRRRDPRARRRWSSSFAESDHATFHDYFAAHRITAEPLPPGIAKNVARGKPLPPGIAKRAVPADLLALGPKVEGVSFAIVGEVVVATKGGVVVDVLAGVFK